MTSFIFQIFSSFFSTPAFRVTRYECPNCKKNYVYPDMRDMCVEEHALLAIREAQKTYQKEPEAPWQLLHCENFYICPLDWRVFKRQKLASQHFKTCLAEHDQKTVEEDMQFVEIAVSKPAAPAKSEGEGVRAQRLPKGVIQNNLQYSCTHCKKNYWVKTDAANCYRSHPLP